MQKEGLSRYWGSVQMALLSRLSDDDLRAFGFINADGLPMHMNRSIADKAISLVHQKLEQRERQTTPAATIQGETPVAKTVKEKNRTEKVETLPAVVVAPVGPQPIVITSGALAELANAITESVGTALHETIDTAIEQAIDYQTITDGQSYTKASEHRKALRGLITTKGDPTEPGRLRVRVTMGIMDEAGQRVAVAAETTIGTKSVDDLYAPLSALLDKLHKATTQGRSEVSGRIEAARSLLERAILTWDDEQRARKQEAERLETLRQEQAVRTEAARHWINQLCEHGEKLESCQALLSHPLDEVTAPEVRALEMRLREKLMEEEKEKQEELAEAIETAKTLDMPFGFINDVVKELEEQKAAPVVIEAPPPPPPLPPRMVAPAVAQAQTPKISGQGRTTHYTLRIDNPHEIPAAWLLPQNDKMYDPDSYPRLRAEARLQGMQLKVPGVTVIPEPKLTQR